MAAFRKSLARRFASLLLPTAADGGVGRPCGFLFLQKRPLFQRALPPDRQLMLLAADRISERVRSLNPCRICLDVILPPARSEAPVSREEGEVLVEKKRVSLVEVRKLARASLVAVVRARLATVEKSCIAYSEFVRICCEASNSEQGLEIARSLDESGVVVVLGNVVFLRPEEVAKTIEKLIPLSSSHESYHTREELKMLEEKKSEIDKQAAAQVRKELWLGLGFMVVQTAALMRVTFWELSWDVMEPICFYLTSVYFLSGYAFFLRTSKEPSFESFFASRFATKQRRLMKVQNFDLTRFNELSQAFSPSLPPPPYSKFASASCHCDRDD
ncbi:calcium uniporter protein 3, mitochondrial-like [Zingiber officinale]|uniref:calcium uniporter protein 3, mitochondrial-like n=1 Tax=Zingiber officinale TaxID=94328 RepID=UPI001C4D5913|nr:calcium uniporter protein 3, mitochondrial-like [Zingiber officinale]